jgi:hypothetical protein
MTEPYYERGMEASEIRTVVEYEFARSEVGD